MDLRLIVTSLRDSCLFENADESALEDIARQLRRRRFRRNETIFHQGDPGDALHIVSSGAVKIVLPSLEGEEAIIATLRSGDLFGELALLDGAPRSASAVALEASETWTLSRDLFLARLDQHDAARLAACGAGARAAPPHRARRGAAFPRSGGSAVESPGSIGTGGRAGVQPGPARLALYAVGPGLDDRGYPAVGEQAAVGAGELSTATAARMTVPCTMRWHRRASPRSWRCP